jgi:hypothetical protein
MQEQSSFRPWDELRPEKASKRRGCPSWAWKQEQSEWVNQGRDHVLVRENNKSRGKGIQEKRDFCIAGE